MDQLRPPVVRDSDHSVLRVLQRRGSGYSETLRAEKILHAELGREGSLSCTRQLAKERLLCVCLKPKAPRLSGRKLLVVTLDKGLLNAQVAEVLQVGA